MESAWDILREEITRQVLMEVDPGRSITDEELEGLIRDRIMASSREHPLDLKSRIALGQEIFNGMRGLDILTPLLEDDSISEIMVNGWNRIFVEQRGQIHRISGHFSSEEKLADVAQQIAGSTNELLNESHPIADMRWKDGSRIHIVIPPVAVDGVMMSVRRFPDQPIDMKRLIALGSISPEIAGQLAALVKAGYNIIVSGGTGSGKTTFLNALTEFIPTNERVITIEDSAELQVIGVGNLVRLEAREAGLDGRLAVTIRELVRTSLRMRPDRIIIGECRGQEAMEMLVASNTGHDGTMSSLHANSTADSISRLTTMALMADLELPLRAIQEQIASGIDIVVHLGRMRDGSRKVLEVTEVLGMAESGVKLLALWKFIENQEQDAKEVSGRWEQVHPLVHRDKLERAGIALPEKKLR